MTPIEYPEKKIIKTSHLLSTIQDIKDPKPGTEEAFLLKKTFLDLESDPMINYLESLEDRIDDLKEEVENLEETQPVIEDIMTEISKIIALTEG